MVSSLITKVSADIAQLEKDLARAEARWRRYEEVARKAASATLTGGSLSGSKGGGASEASKAKSELKRQEEELKAAQKRQLEELKNTLRLKTLARQAATDNDLAILKAALEKEMELLKQRGKQALQEQKSQDSQAAENRKEARRKEQEAIRNAEKDRKKAEDDVAKRTREEFAIRETQRLFREKKQKEAAKDAIKAREQERKDNDRAIKDADRAAREQGRLQAADRRAQAGDLRSQIRQVTGGFGGGPPFRPVPTGSRPEDIRALVRHLNEANSAGARLSRTLRRIGENDMRNLIQSFRFFGNAVKLTIAGIAIAGFTGLVKRGIELNREWERFRFGLGTALSLTSKVVDAQGNLVTGARAFRVFAADGEKLFRNIREEANKTILTTEELTEVVTTNFSQALRAGVPEKEIIGLTSRIAQVAKSVGLQGGTPQLIQEVRAILSGDTLRGATVAQILGLTSEELKNAREAGTLLELLNERLAGAKPLVDAFGKSSEAAFTTLASKGQDFLRLSLENVFERLTGRVLDFNKELTGDDIARFADRTGKFLEEMIAPVERFIDSGNAAKLGDTFVSAFTAIERVASSGALDSLNTFFSLLARNADKLIPLFVAIAGIRGVAIASAGLASLGAPGGLAAGTRFGNRVAGGIPGLLGIGGSAAGAAGAGAAGAAGAGLLARTAGAARTGVATFGALGARGTLLSGGALLGQGLLRALPPVAIGSAIAGGLTLPFGIAQGAQLSAEAQRLALRREPGARATGARLGIARDALQQVQTQIRAAAERGERVTTATRFPVALGGDTERTIQLSFDQAQRRVAIAEDAEKKLLNVAKDGGDKRVQNEKDVNAQILDLDRLQTQQRIAQLEGDARKQIELETVLNVASAQVGDNAIKNERDRQQFILAARQEGRRKLNELEREAFLATVKAEAEAAGNRRRERQVEAARDLDTIQESVRTRTITVEQGERQITARLKQLRREDLEDFRATRDRGVALQDEFTKLTLRALRERRDAEKAVADFQRKTAREARALVRERIDSERELTETIRQQVELRENVELARGRRGLRDRAEGALREAGFGERLRTREVAGLRGVVAPGEEDALARVRAERELRRVAGLLVEGNVDEAASALGRGGRVNRAALERLAAQLEFGGGTLGLREEDLARRREVEGEGRALTDSDRAVRRGREDLVELGIREREAREDAAREFRDLQDRIKDATLGLKENFTDLGRQARELLPDLGQFGTELRSLANVINEIARLQPRTAGARAATFGPGNVNLTVDLRGALGGATLDSLDAQTSRVLDLALSKIQEQIRRGPVRGGGG